MIDPFLISSLLLLLFFSGFFSSSETAYFSLSQTKLKAYSSSIELRKRMVANLLAHPKDLLVTIFMLNTLVNILLQNVASSMAGESGSWLIKVLVPFALLLFIGEIVPKYIGLQKNEVLAQRLAPIFSWIQKIIGPVREATIFATAPFSRILFFFLRKEEEISQEELQHLLVQSKQTGVLKEEEAEIVEGYLIFQEQSVKEVMRPREEMLFYEIHEPLTKLTHLFVDQQVSRLPVCDGDLQNILGIIDVQDFFLQQEQIANNSFEIQNCLKKPFYIPETTPAKLLLRRLYDQKEQLALVVDEYGAIAGLVTNEDLIESIIGEIHDLRDKKTLYTQPNPGELICSGRLELSEFNSLMNLQLRSPNNMVTLGGWLTETLEMIPKAGAKFEKNDLLFHILAANPTHIERLYVRRLKEKESS